MEATKRHHQQRQWLESHGGTLAGYLTYYAGSGYSEEEIREIFRADWMATQATGQRARRVA